MERREILPANIKFRGVKLDAKCCYKRGIGKGQCSLELDFDESVEKTDRQGCYDEKEGCQSLYIALKKDPEIGHKSVEISKLKCGGYRVTEGQHRICIAQKMNLPVVVDAFGEVPKCNICREWFCKIACAIHFTENEF